MWLHKKGHMIVESFQASLFYLIKKQCDWSSFEK